MIYLLVAERPDEEPAQSHEPCIVKEERMPVTLYEQSADPNDCRSTVYVEGNAVMSTVSDQNNEGKSRSFLNIYQSEFMPQIARTGSIGLTIINSKLRGAPPLPGGRGL